MLYGIMNNGSPFWLFVAVRPSRYHLFMTAYRDGTLDIHKFTPYGEVIVIGEGKNPSNDVVGKVAKMYQTTPEILMNSMHDEPPPEASP